MRLPPVLTALLVSASLLRADSLTFSDPFTLTGEANDTNLNASVPARQSGPLAGGTWTELPTSPAGYTNDGLIEKNATVPGTGDSLLLRSFHSSASSQMAVRLSTNFGPQVSGRKWRFSSRGHLQRSSADITDIWLSFDFGDTAGHTGPNNASTDFGFFIRGNGATSVWTDNSNVANGAALKSPDILNTAWTLDLTMDETTSPATASAVVTVDGGGTFPLGPWTVTWENPARYLEIRLHNGSNANSPGSTAEARMDDLSVSLVGDALAPPVVSVQPQTVWLGDNTILTAKAESTSAVTWQWSLEGSPISGATGASLSLPAVSLANGGTYTVTATNVNGSTPANTTLTVIYPNRWQRAVEPLAISSKRTGLIISEIMPHPAPRTDGKNAEFIELYNTNPWPEDLTGWRLSGDVEYAFPAGTAIPAQGFLVVAAVPADLQTLHSLTGVLGPWTGALSNKGGSVRLRRKNDAIVLDALWNDGPDWPAAADGAGHSLILARPSFGEADVRSYAPGAAVGGSPGQAESPPDSPQDHVVFNEILAHSITGTDYVELHNSSPLTIGVGGCWISDDAALLTKFQIPAGTTLVPRGQISFTQAQLGFALSAEGETLYFTNAAQTRVLDAVRFRGQAPDTASGRFPDGEGPLRPLTTATPGQPNPAPVRGPVVINELYFNPITGDDRDEWLELRNLTGSPVDLSGWRLSDGVAYDFPAGTVIAANGYLVIAADPARTAAHHPALPPALILGPFNGSLSNSGEEVVLARRVLPEGTLPPWFASVDEVSYQDKTRWSQWADGGGSSLELADARSTATPLWLDSDESAKAPWTLVETTGVLDNINTNTAGGGVADRLDAMLLGAGEALMDDVAATPSGGTNRVANPGFETTLTPWLVQGTHNRSVLENSGFTGGKSLRMVATGRGDPYPNRIRTPLTSTLTVGSTATISARVRWLRGCPEFLLRLKGGGLEAIGNLTVPTNLGTPGAANSRAVSNAAPAITGVLHRPALPPAGAPFRIFAHVSDPDGIGSVIVNYRIDPNTTVLTAPMVDDGTAGDLLSGDGIFTATLPSRPAGTLLSFAITATDSAIPGAGATFPPTGDCLVRIGDSVPAGAFGAYTFWLKSATLTSWTNRLPKTNEPFPITLLHNQSRILYGTGAHNAQNAESTGNNPLTVIVGYEIDLPPGEPLFGENDVTLDWPVRDVTNQREQLMHWMLEQMNLPTLHRRDVHLMVNGQRRNSATIPILHDAHQPGGSYVDSNFSTDPDGRLLKTNVWEESGDDGTRLIGNRNTLLPLTTTGGVYKTAAYRWNWRPRATNRGQSDYTEFYELVAAANTTGAGYTAAVDRVADMDQWMRNFAFADLCAFWDTFGNAGAKNAYLYRPSAGRWQVLTNDMDVGLGGDINANSPPSSYPLTTASIDSPVQRMFDHPAFIRHYWRAIHESLGTFFKGSAVTTRVTQRYNGYLANGVAVTSPLTGSGPHNLSLPAWIDQRVPYLQSQLATVNAAFVVSGAANFTTAVSPVTLSGTAPVAVKSITFNGLEHPLTWTTPTAWRVSLSVRPGSHPVVVSAFDGFGAPAGTTTLTVNFTGTASWPALRLNEWMASNSGLVTDPADGRTDDWLELYNPTASPVDLAGWTLSDSNPAPHSYLIPSGYSIPAMGRLLVWADGEPFQNTGSGPLHADFRLSAGGETLTLAAPDGTVVDTVTFGPQPDSISQGRTPDGGGTIDFLGTPGAGTPNSQALPLPSATASLTAGTVSFTVTTTPGFSYQLQYSDVMGTSGWINAGTPVPATGSSLTFTDTPPPALPRRFYRAARFP